MTIRVVQWTTGHVGRRSVRAVIAHPGLELVGCYAHSADKVGRDAGDLAGTDPVGVVATDDVDALLALAPDCVVYNPLWPDVAEMERILGAGVNMVTTAGFLTGHALGPDGRARIAEACRAGGSSVFGSGMNPGFANLLGLVSAGICDRIDSVTVLESVDAAGYGSAETERSVGYGRPVDDPALAELVEAGTAVFGDAVHAMADALAVDLDEVVCEPEWAGTTVDVDLGYMTIPAGCVAGVGASWQGRAGGRTVIDLRVRWRKGDRLDREWPLEHGYVVEVEGMPCVRTKLDIRPPRDFRASSMADFMELGMVMTALPAVNAVAAVVAAAPGIRTYADLPLITGAGFVPPGRV